MNREMKKGFTLMELMVVVAITAVIMAIAIPNVVSWRNNQQLSRAARQVFVDIQATRMSAVKYNQFAFIQFDTGNGTYVAWRDSPAGAASGVLDPGDDPVILRGNMPPGVEMSAAAFSAPNGDTAGFSPMGLCRWPTGAFRSGSVTVTNGVRDSRIIVNESGSIRTES
ncbi:MAG: GspH/FimT family pseudopilin [Thermodesulfobacteriota bacterium]|nr:GspH/FimT family pseudopilin [Thermodesulfobacteriota bacterium]